MNRFDLCVIGSGPGGYVSAIKGAQLGMKVVCVEKGKTLGGTCLNVGCIPSKALLHSSEVFHKAQTEGEHLGFEASLRLDFGQMMRRKEGIVSKLTGGIDYLFKKNKVTRMTGHAKVTGPNSVLVDGKEAIEATHILLATGSTPMELPFLPFDEKKILSSTGALALQEVPKKMIMIGAGVIGLELGSVYQRLGSEVTVIELFDRPCPTLDVEVSKTLHKIFQKQGMELHFSCKVTKGETTDDGVALNFEDQNQVEQTVVADVCLVAVGRKPFSEGLGLEEVGIEKDQGGRVVVNGLFQTTIPSIYAIGDLIDGPMLAHKASEEGVAAVEIMHGQSPSINYAAIPNVMYTWPEMASVGLTEEEAKEKGIEVLIGKCPFMAIPRARCMDEHDGLVKLIAHKASRKLIGMHIVGPNASEMIGVGVAAIVGKMSVDELAHASSAHPTCAEAIKEAALAAIGSPLHL